MSPFWSILPRADHVPQKVPVGGDVMSVVITLGAVTVLSAFLFQRINSVKNWRQLPFVWWLVFAIYVDSYFFVIATAILQQVFGVNTHHNICHGAILLCLVCYVTTKILIYVFLVEKAYIIRSTTTTRMKSKLYLFNMFGMLGCYGIVVILNFVFRIAKIENGQCIIGMKSIAMIPLISFDAVVNVYLTILFLIPLKNLYSFKNMPRTPATLRLKTMAFRTFIGACCTLVSSIVNLTVLMVLNGEPGWVCLMCCNSDILFSAIVIQWVTSRDSAGSSSQPNSAVQGDYQGGTHPSMGLHPINPGPRPKSPAGTDAEVSLVDPATNCGSSEHNGDFEIFKAGRDTGRGVMVTTTIHRQSRSTSGADLQLTNTRSTMNGGESIDGSDTSYDGITPIDIINPPRTYITGGTKSPQPRFDV